MEETRICNTCNTEMPIYKFYSGYKKNGERKLLRKCFHCLYKKRLDSDPKTLWKRHIKKYYNMSPEDYENLLKLAGYACEICKEPSEKLTIDHDHSCCSEEFSCGKCVRGLLCHKCNRGIGQLKDSIEILENAIKYLKTKTPTFM